MFRVGGCLNRLASPSPRSTTPPLPPDMSLIPALVSRSKWKISKTDIRARPHAAASKNSDNRLFSRGKEDRGRKRILFSYRVTRLPPTVLYDRSIHPSRQHDEPKLVDRNPPSSPIVFRGLESNRIESLVKQSTSKTWDRIGLESAPFLCPPRAPLEAAACRAPGLQPLPLPRISICRTLPRAVDGKCYRQCVSARPKRHWNPVEILAVSRFDREGEGEGGVYDT